MERVLHRWLNGRKTALLAASFVVSGWYGPNLPSAAAADVGAAGSGQGDTGLMEIIVTAQRRSENIQRAPIPVSVVSNDTLIDAGVVSAVDLARLVPAAQFSAASSPFPLLYMRGVGSDTGTSFTDPAVTVSYDGVPMARPYQGTGQYFDLRRVEVLIGPQGTLYGRNATGGAVNLIPARPELNKTYSDVGIEFGDWNTLRLSAVGNVPLNDSSAFRASFRTSRNDGYWSENSGATDSQAARMQVLTQPGQDLSVNIGTDYYRSSGTATNGVVDRGSTVLQIPISLGPTGPDFVKTLILPTAGFPNSAGISLSDPRLASAFQAQGLTPPSPGMDNNNSHIYGVNSTVNWITDVGTLTVIPAYRHANLNFLSYGAGFGLGVNERDDQETVEARLASGESKALKWIVGGFYIHDHVQSHMDIDTFAPAFLGTSVDNHFTIDTKSYAPFIDATLKITDSIRLIGGVRYTVDRKQPTGSLSSMRPPPTTFDCTPADARCVSLTGTPTKQWSATTYRGGVEWDLTPSSMAYATYATGWHSGGFFFTHDNPEYQPEELDAFTLGTKNRFLDNRLQANAEIFYWKYLNEQTSFVAVDSQGTADFVTKNVGRSSRSGVDSDLEYRVTADTTVGIQAQYLRAVYQQYQYLVSSAFPLNTGCRTTFPDPAHLLVDCANSVVPYAPKWTVNLPLQQTVHLPGGGRLDGLLRVHFQTDQSTGTEDVPIEIQHRYATLDLSLGYHAHDDRFSVTVYGDNLTNRVIKSQTFQSTATGILGAQQAMYFETLKAPLTFGVRFAEHFGD